jgi:ribose 5-phosphate isomerase B
MAEMNRWRVAVGSDEAGFEHKEMIKRDLENDDRVASIVDVGVKAGERATYSSIGLIVAQKVANGDIDRGILICGTGIGMAIAANKVRGVRATVIHDSYSCERSVLSNNCQIIAFGQRVIGPELTRRLAREWLGYVFDQRTPSQGKLAVIDEYEETFEECE